MKESWMMKCKICDVRGNLPVKWWNKTQTSSLCVLEQSFSTGGSRTSEGPQAAPKGSASLVNSSLDFFMLHCLQVLSFSITVFYFHIGVKT
jgi:hypothetical protein